MAEPSPRQLLYAMVAAGFHVVVGVLVIGSAPLAPTWWTASMAVVWIVVAAILALRWRRTVLVLAVSLGGFIAWTMGAAVLLA
jgi:hypothetical protein